MSLTIVPRGAGPPFYNSELKSIWAKDIWIFERNVCLMLSYEYEELR